MEEYNIKIHYIKGVENKVADVLSRYPTQNDPDGDSKEPNASKMSEIFATENDLPSDAFLLSFKKFSNFQNWDRSTDALLTKDVNKKHVSRQIFHGGEQLVCYDGRIFVSSGRDTNQRNYLTTFMVA